MEWDKFRAERNIFFNETTGENARRLREIVPGQRKRKYRKSPAIRFPALKAAT
jgi:hypothetical protein